MPDSCILAFEEACCYEQDGIRYGEMAVLSPTNTAVARWWEVWPRGNPGHAS